ncbi:serine/threonine protein phosphatase [Macrococcoides goetzii]|nr:serine/threonine protein phosphatase [Macrococcus goetzii]TDM45664.1 serine/threonine protein phosphatase [Macrococcus goetzii]TDM48710.1 serine/threonine protein phosphatase [Macrococcus goetzii]
MLIKGGHMKILIIGDVHGYFQPFQQLIDRYADKVDLVIQLGDLIDRGPSTKDVLDLAIKLEQEDKYIFLKGNHEFELLLHHESGMNEHWHNQMGKQTLEQLSDNYEEYINWLNHRPLKYETDGILVTHAGIANIETDYWDEDNEHGILWNRLPLKRLNKFQIHGHTPTHSGDVEINQQSNSCNIDTGMGLGNKLSGIIIEDDKIIEIIS